MPPARRDPDGRAADSVMRAAGFVEERLGEPVGVEDMAAAACYSPFYFSRLFAQATGHSPYDYLMRRRTAAAAEEVVAAGRSLTEIALDHGFEAPDSFARAFRRCFGSSPAEARRARSYPRALARTPVSRPYVEYLLAAGLPRPSPFESAGATLVGSWLREPVIPAGPEPRLPGGGAPLAVVERDGALAPIRSFAGAAGAPGEAPGFPLASTRLPGGEYARFPPAAASELAFVVEFAYRAWLPGAGRCAPPPFDLVEGGPGGSLSLLLPLGPWGPGTAAPGGRR